MKIASLGAAVLISSGLLWAAMLRLGNPDMTETRLFLAFWPQWVAITGLAGAALLCIKLAGDN